MIQLSNARPMLAHTVKQMRTNASISFKIFISNYGFVLLHILNTLRFNFSSPQIDICRVRICFWNEHVAD